jgi:ABC-type sulfate/molybdate transport systems ATPase subunit
MAFLELDALSARYGKNTVVADLSLVAEKGEFLSILGPSGCGKTTTLRMIAGFVAPSAGAIRVAGRAIQDVAPHRRNIGYVFQNYALFPHLTTRENVAFGLRMRHVAKAAQIERAAKALDLVGLGHLGDRYPAQLSGGQQQRVALARALVIEPDLLLLDEPLSNLDAALRGQMRSEIRALQRRLAITTVFVTHDQAEALAMSDRIAVMDHGRLVEAATPQASVAGFRAFTFKWYAAIFEVGAYLRAFEISAQLAAASVACALALALPAAFALVRFGYPGRGAVQAFWMLPLALPHVAIGVGMLRLLQWYIAIPPFMGLLLVHVVLIVPFAISLLRSSVLQLDTALEQAAASLGANPVRVFFLIVLPNLAPGLAVAGIIGFLISFGEVTVTSFLTTARLTTLPVRIYAEASFSLEPTVHAVSTLLILATVALLAIVNRFVKLDRVWAK